MARVVTGAVALFLTACAQYTARPLTSAAVSTALAVRPPSTLWVKRAHVLLPSLPPLIVHPGERLSPDLAAVVAVVADPALRALRQREAIAASQVLSAGLLPNPTFSYGIGVPISGAGLTNAFRVGLGLPIRSLITRAPRLRAAQLHAQAVDLTVAWKEWQVAARAKALVYELLVGQHELRLLAREVRALRHSVELLSDAEAAGYATLGVAGAARLTLHQTELSRIIVRRHVALARLKLRGLLGLPAHAVLHLVRPHRSDSLAPSCLAGTFWTQGLARRRLDLLALRRGYRSQNAALRAALAGQFPAITVGLNRARDTSDINTLGGGVSIGLPFFNHNQGAIAFARASRRALFHVYAARLFTARATIHQLLTRIHYLRLEMRSTRSSVHALGRLEVLYRRALTKQRIAALTYYQLLGQAVGAQLLLLQDQARLEQLRVGLEAASGRFEWPTPCIQEAP